MQSPLNLQSSFTFDFFIRMDGNVSDNNAVIWSSTQIYTTWWNGTFQTGQNYYGFGLGQNFSAYFYINNTNWKQYCIQWFDGFFDPTLDSGMWLYMSVSVSEFSQYSTNVCVYKKGWGVSAYCQVLGCKLPPYTSGTFYYFGGGSFTGAIKTIEIWNYPKAINVMGFSPLFGLVSPSQPQIADNKGSCNPFDPNGGTQFIGYCPVCDKYTRVSGEIATCDSPCPFYYYDQLCQQRCQNNLCEVCTGGTPADCQVCVPGAELNSTSQLCACIYSEYYLSSDGLSCIPCSSRCYGCQGTSFYQCLGCQPGFIPVTDKDICGSGVCCFASCQEYSRFYYLNTQLNLCIYCGNNMYSLDGLTCTGMATSSILSLDTSMKQLTVNFSRPLTNDMTYSQLLSAFSITISGPRASYPLQWDMNKQEWPAGVYLTQVTFNLSIECTLYGIETLKIQYNDQMGFFDKNMIPLGGDASLKTTTYPYSYLSASDASTTSSANSTASQSSIVSMVMMIGIQAIAGGSIEAMFCLSYMMQIASFLPLINVYFPTNAGQMFTALSFVNANNQVLTNIFQTYFVNPNTYTNTTPYSNNFNTYGVNDCQFLDASPDQILIIIILVAIYPLIFFAKYMFSHMGSLCKEIIEIENSFHWNASIKAYQQMFLQMCVSAVLNIYVLNQPQTWSDYVSLYSAYFFVAVGVFLSVFSVIFVHLNRRFLNHKKFQHTWGALIIGGELKLKKPYQYLYLWTFFTRRFLFAAMLVLYIDYPTTQIVIHLGLCIFILLWHLILWPFKSNMINFFYVFNEVILIIVGCMMFLFLDPSLPESQANMYGYLMIIIVVLSIIVNWGVILPAKFMEGIQAFKDMIKKRDDKVRYEIEKKYLVFDSEYDQNMNEVIGQRILTRNERLNSQLRNRFTPSSNQEVSFRKEQPIPEEENQRLGIDFFPINREVEGQDAMNTLDSFREAVREEEKKEESLKKERTPLMDPEMMKKKPSTKPKYAGKTAMRPMTQANHGMRVFTPLSGSKQAEPQANLSQNQSLKSLDEGFNPVYASLNDKVPFERETAPLPQNQPPYRPIYIQSEDSSIGRPISADSKDIQPFEQSPQVPSVNPQTYPHDDNDHDIGIAYDENTIKFNLHGFANKRKDFLSDNANQPNPKPSSRFFDLL